MLRITFQIILLGLSAVFSGSETALFSLSRIDLQKLRLNRDKYSENIHAMLDEPRRLIISILCGNELVNIASAVNMTGILLLVFEEGDVSWINILVMVPLLLLIGEVLRKRSDDAAGQRDIFEFNLNPGRCRVGSDDREQRCRRQCGSFVGKCVDNFCGRSRHKNYWVEM